MADDAARLTRRDTVLIGGAAAVAGVAGRFTGPPAAAANDGTELPWDVRDLVPDAELDPPHVQCTYDDINRLAVLIGDIRFGRLFRNRIDVLVPIVLPRVDLAADLGLIKAPEEVKAAMTELAEAAGGLTIGALYAQQRGQIPGHARRLVLELWRHGIRLPFPSTNLRRARLKQRALRDVIRFNRRMTFISFYETPQESIPPRAMAALNNGKRLMLLGWGKNDRCCKKRGGQAGILDACISSSGRSCYLSNSPISRGLCTAASDLCPGQKGHTH